MSEGREAEIERWFKEMVSAKAHDAHLVVDDCRIAYRRWGSPLGENVVLVHGGRAHSRWWDHIGSALSARYNVAALDLSGNGESGRRPLYSWRHWALEVIGVLRAISTNDARSFIVAHSMGGFVAIKTAAEFNDEVDGVVLVDIPFSINRRGEPRGNGASSTPQSRYFPTRANALEHFRLVPEQPGTLPFIQDYIAQSSIMPAGAGWTWKADPNTRVRLDEIDDDTLARVRCPITVLRAEHGVVPRDFPSTLDPDMAKNISVVDIPLAYHHMMIDQPIALLACVQAVIGEWSRTAVLDGRSTSREEDCPDSR